MGINVDEVYAGDTMNAAWVKSQGGNITGKVSHVEVRTFGAEDEPKERKVVLHFDGIEKVLSLNVTNKNIIRDSWGPEAEEWIGRTLAIKVHRTSYMGKPTDGIIVECVAGNGAANGAAATPSPAKTIVLGAAGEQRIMNRLAAMKPAGKVDQLRAVLTDANVQPAEAVSASPSEWPAAWANTIKEALETMDIPF